ncbi:MAG: hypothetical protein ACI9Y1_001372 [Lentisphaeria bacterium]|jgi:hypothetical protein
MRQIRALAHNMKPTIHWTEDWEIGIDIRRESEISKQVLDLFVEFWSDEGIKEKSKSTLNRYRAALTSLGSYVVEQSTSEEGSGKTAKELLLNSIDEEGGPFLFQDEKTWQNDFDMVCRKLHKYYARKKC